jgi:pyridoxamine 5'-phosphate oxidase
MSVNDPFTLFDEWLAIALRAEPINPTAMCLATVGRDGRPAARMVLLKGHDRSGFVFYTNTESDKGRELAADPRAALCFYWRTVGLQVRIEGDVVPVTAAEADAYFATRERGSRIGAWASAQSRPLASREALERRVAELEAQYRDAAVPRPPHWSGYRVVPERLEFWRDRPDRLHDRQLFVRHSDGWTETRLNP